MTNLPPYFNYMRGCGAETVLTAVTIILSNGAWLEIAYSHLKRKMFGTDP
jgi:hypothetical protein